MPRSLARPRHYYPSNFKWLLIPFIFCLPFINTNPQTSQGAHFIPSIYSTPANSRTIQRIMYQSNDEGYSQNLKKKKKNCTHFSYKDYLLCVLLYDNLHLYKIFGSGPSFVAYNIHLKDSEIRNQSFKIHTPKVKKRNEDI